jgi:putative membrane protein
MSTSGLLLRSAAGGILMGLANLVPGISGGTMLLAVGIYTYFISGIAELTRFRFRDRSVTVLAVVIVAAAAGILLLAGPVKTLVVSHRWIMYSLFIGLTVGGAPIVWRMISAPDRAVWIGAVCGFAGMAVLAWFQQQGIGTGTSGEGAWIMLLIAGIAGASAMILPGISGGYLLLVLGQYVPILSAVDLFRQGLSSFDVPLLLDVGVRVILPVGIGIVAGVVVVSNLLKYLLKKYHNATLGVLLGLLIGAVVGLWPFQEETGFFAPSAGQIVAALALVAAGLGITFAVSKIGSSGT